MARRAGERRRARKQISKTDQDFLNLVRQRFHDHVDGGRRMTPAELGRFLGVGNSYFSRRLFAVLDDDGDGRVSETDFLKSVVSLILGEDEDKLRFIFRSTGGVPFQDGAVLGVDHSHRLPLPLPVAQEKCHSQAHDVERRDRPADVHARRQPRNGDEAGDYQDARGHAEDHPHDESRVTGTLDGGSEDDVGGVEERVDRDESKKYDREVRDPRK